MPDLCETAYAAGLFDGEGCVQLYMRPTSRKVYDEPWRQARGYRPLHRWVVYSRQAEQFARDIQPFLITKREQVDLWLRAREMTVRKGQKGVTSDELTERLAIVGEIKRLKVAA